MSAPHLVELATMFLRGYFADGLPHTPSDLEDDILGGQRGGDILNLGRHRWFDTPFHQALVAMVKRGEIEVRQDDEEWSYRLAIKAASA